MYVFIRIRTVTAMAAVLGFCLVPTIGAGLVCLKGGTKIRWV
jgi:hypothetical protein